MTIQTDFEERFAGVAPPIVWQSWVESVWPSYTCLAYNDKNKEAILNLIAHLLVTDGQPGTGASRTAESKSVGSVSVSYGSASSGSNLATFFNSTRYGQRYWLLTGRQVGARFV
jgi:hypothetical protein